MNADDTPPQPEVTKLPPAYDTALLGSTVSTHGEDHFAYSLRMLIGLVMLERQCQAPEARQVIYHEFIKPFSHEVCFINDELLEPVEEKKSVIILPTKVNGRRWK